MGRVERSRELARRRTRRAKIKKLKLRYMKSRNEGDKVEIAAAIRKISPLYPIELLSQ